MLCWNVYWSNYDNGEIEVYNIFNHWSFFEACVKAKKKFKEDKEGFADDVRGWLMYYFWSKTEWEIILSHWPDGEWSELRQQMEVGELKDILAKRGADVSSWRLSDRVIDRDVELRIYPTWLRYRELKIDVYQQVINNWDHFIDYLWNNRKELRVRKKDAAKPFT